MADAARGVHGIVGKGIGNCLLAGPHLHGRIIGRSRRMQLHELRTAQQKLLYIYRRKICYCCLECCSACTLGCTTL